MHQIAPIPQIRHWQWVCAAFFKHSAKLVFTFGLPGVANLPPVGYATDYNHKRTRRGGGQPPRLEKFQGKRKLLKNPE